MRSSLRQGWAMLAVAALALAATPIAAAGYRAPRTSSGRPDLQGLWTIASLTGLERGKGFTTLVISQAQAKAFEAAEDGTPHIPDDATGQNESEWWDRGATLARIGGQVRTSWLVDPANGKLPYSPSGLKRLRAAQAALLTAMDGPESRPATERCLTGTGGSTLAPLQNAVYGNLYQVVQTRDDVVIAAELNHEARIIPLQASERGLALGGWSGVSTGRWEGDTLVVETSHFNPGVGWRAGGALYLSPDAKVTERFTRTSANEILYAYTVDDPAMFTQVWRAESVLRRAAGPMYEYACHEGNYSMTGVLAGAREEERAAKARPAAGR